VLKLPTARGDTLFKRGWAPGAPSVPDVSTISRRQFGGRASEHSENIEGHARKQDVFSEAPTSQHTVNSPSGGRGHGNVARFINDRKDEGEGNKNPWPRNVSVATDPILSPVPFILSLSKRGVRVKKGVRVDKS